MSILKTYNKVVVVLLAFSLVSLIPSSSGFITSSSIPSRKTATFFVRSSSSTLIQQQKDDNDEERDKDGNIKKNWFEQILDPKPTKIPKGIKDEIYKAEGSTPAAKNRNQRLVFYFVSCGLLITFAFVNAIINELTSQANSVRDIPITYTELGFGFVEFNAITKFLFTDGIGGYFDIIVGAILGFVGEAELDGQRLNAEKIYAEFERRKKERNKATPRKTRRKAQATSTKKKKKNRETSQKKRLNALSEILSEEETQEEEIKMPTPATATESSSKEEEDGFMGKLKGWYKQADSMAASQALLLNKELEEKGVLEKITDESGLTVVGKEAAAKIQEEEEERRKTTSTTNSTKLD